MGYIANLRAAMPQVPQLLRQFDAMAARAERGLIGNADAIVRLADAYVASRRPTPPTTSVTQIIPINVSQWGVPDVRAALDGHELGMFMDSTTLMDAMGRDDRITGCLNTRVRALAGKSGVGFSVKPSTRGDKATCEDYAKAIEDTWYYTCPESVMSHVLRDAVMLGVGFAKVHWDLVNGRRVPRLEPWDARGVYWDWSIRRYRAISLEGIFTIDPGSAEWFVFEPGGYRGWMYGAIRGLGLPWVFRGFSLRDWARYNEKHGLPMLAIKEPSGTQWERHKASFWNRVKNIGSEASVRLPTDEKGYGFDVSYVEPKDKSWGAFQAYIERLDINVAVMLLGQNLSTEVKGGSRAAAMAHNLIRLDYLDADAQTLSTALREQLLKPYLRFNIDGANEEDAPYPTWETRPPEDKSERVKIFAGFIDMVKAATDPDVRKAAPVDFVAAAKELDITLLDAAPTEDKAAVKPFKYHFDYGLLTRDEGRATLELPPVGAANGGNEIPQPVAAPQPGAPPEGASALLKVTAGGTGKHGGTEEDRIRARSAVNQKVRSGKLKPANDMPCEECGHVYNGKDGVRHEYDHHLGYSVDHTHDVQSICTDCHKTRSLKEYGRLAALAITSGLPTRTIGGIAITIDRPAGFVQQGIGADGTPWERTYTVDYGFIGLDPGSSAHGTTDGGDKEALDVFCGPNAAAPNAFWILQLKADGSFDEFKVGIGFNTLAEFVACYTAHIPRVLMGESFTMPISALRALMGMDPNGRGAVLSALSTGHSAVLTNVSVQCRALNISRA